MIPLCFSSDKQSSNELQSEPEELLVQIIDYSKCIGKTLSNNQCSNKPCKGSLFCSRHKNLFKFDKPEECPVCTESLANSPQPLSCGHWVHRSCVINWKDECPICRSKIRLTKKERNRLLAKNADTSPENGSIYVTHEGFVFTINADQESMILEIRHIINNIINVFQNSDIVSDEDL